VAAQALNPDIALQIDLMLATDTPDMADRGDMVLGGGPGISLYSFHGRGTLNGVIPHPALVRLFEDAARDAQMALQRSAQVGVLTDLSYVQLVGQGVASLDIGFLWGRAWPASISAFRCAIRILRWNAAICPISRRWPG